MTSATLAKKQRHVFSIDVECWYQLVNRNNGCDTGVNRTAVDRQMNRILGLLEEHKTVATFFILEGIAKQNPELAPQLVALGHEVGIHGTAHRPLYEHTPKSLRQDLIACKKRMEDQIGMAVNSHRAPRFSITKNNLWAFDILAEVGLTIDSSVFPMQLGRYGIRGFPRRGHWVRGPAGGRIFEVPLSIVHWLSLSWPVSGGGYARILPQGVLASAARRLEHEELPLVLYFHPYEFDPEPLIPPPSIPAWQRYMTSARWNIFRESIHSKLDYLLENFRFGRLDTFVRDQYMQSETHG